MVTAGGGCRVSPRTLDGERAPGTGICLVIQTTPTHDADDVAGPDHTGLDHPGVEATQPQLLARLAVHEARRVVAVAGDELGAAVVRLGADLDDGPAGAGLPERQPRPGRQVGVREIEV